MSGINFHETGAFIEAHPLASVSIAVGVVLLLWYVSSGNTPAPVASSDGGMTAAAAQVAQSQIAANASTQQASIAAGSADTAASLAAGVANNQTAAALSLSALQSNNAASVAAANSSASVAVSGNTTISAEFSSLADALKTYAGITNTTAGNGDAYVALANSTVAGKLGTTESANFLQALTGGSSQYQTHGDSAVSSWQTTTADATRTSSSATSSDSSSQSMFGPFWAWFGGGGGGSSSDTAQAVAAENYVSTNTTQSGGGTANNAMTQSAYTYGQGALTSAGTSAALTSADFTSIMSTLGNKLGSGVAFHA